MADIIVDGRTSVWFVPTISSPTLAPTVAEIGAGTPLHDFLVPQGLEGFEIQQATVDNTALSSTYDTTLPGRKSASGTGLLFKEQSGSAPAWLTALAEDTNGYIVIRDGVLTSVAVAAAQKVDVYPIRTGEGNKVGRGEANSLLRRRIPTPIQAPAKKDLAILA